METDLDNRLKLYTGREDIPDVFIQLLPINVKIFNQIQYLIWCKINNKIDIRRKGERLYTYLYIYIKYIYITIKNMFQKQ